MGRDEPFWETLDGRSPLYRAEARDYVRRLAAAVPVGSSARVLDFGCGFGFVAVELAPRVLEVRLWDGSPHMRALAARNTAGCANVRVLGAPPGEASGSGPFDLVVINSVLQYLDDEGAREVLVGLRSVLHSSGSIVVSDVVAPESSFPRELAQLLFFAFRHRLLAALAREYVSIGRRYAAFLRQRQSRRWTRADLRRLAEGASLVTEFLPANLTCRTRRLAAVMRPRIQSKPDVAPSMCLHRDSSTRR